MAKEKIQAHIDKIKNELLQLGPMQQWVSLTLELSKLELQEARQATPKHTRSRHS